MGDRATLNETLFASLAHVRDEAHVQIPRQRG
jgi:hypothetical protein